MSGRVEVRIAGPDERGVIANLMQLYVHDFADYLAPEKAAELEDDGRFSDYPLDPWWSAPDHIPLLLRIEGRLVGFAMLNATSHSARPVDRNMAEFWIARKYRRGGVGTEAARTIFRLYPGLWEAAVARRNTDALPFWRKAVGGCPGVHDIEETDHATADWNGPILRFRIKA